MFTGTTGKYYSEAKINTIGFWTTTNISSYKIYCNIIYH
jgi:hypothetical protein